MDAQMYVLIFLKTTSTDAADIYLLVLHAWKYLKIVDLVTIFQFSITPLDHLLRALKFAPIIVGQF